MAGDGVGAFHLTLPAVDRDFEYRVQAGPASSDWFTVRIAEPVELGEHSTITIAPPEYAASSRKPAAIGFTDVAALQHSTAKFDLHFSRPAESAMLEWRPDGRSPFEAPDLFPLQMGVQRTSGAAMLPLRSSGSLRLVLVNEAGPRKLRTEAAIAVRTTPDAPPQFEMIAGLAVQPRLARPGDKLHFGFIATDDLGIASAELEFAVNGGDAKRTPIMLSTDAGSTRAEGRSVFDPAGKVADGETVIDVPPKLSTRRGSTAWWTPAPDGSTSSPHGLGFRDRS
jgi:hypothetical protein